MRSIALLLLCLAGLVFAVMPAHAARSYDGCTAFITSVPTVVNSPGVYCMNQDLATSITSGDAISILGSNITIDCNDFRLDGIAAGAGTTAVGIFGQFDDNITVRNCNVRGFQRGIDLEVPNFSGAANYLVEDNHLDANTGTGIIVTGDYSIVRRNVVLDTGGSTAASGISAAANVDVSDNTISGVSTQAGSGEAAYGIKLTSNTWGTVRHNRIDGIVTSASGLSVGISTDIRRGIIRDNILTGPGTSSSQGITCASFDNEPMRDNVVQGFAFTTLGGCADAGGNDFQP